MTFIITLFFFKEYNRLFNYGCLSERCQLCHRVSYCYVCMYTSSYYDIQLACICVVGFVKDILYYYIQHVVYLSVVPLCLPIKHCTFNACTRYLANCFPWIPDFIGFQCKLKSITKRMFYTSAQAENYNTTVSIHSFTKKHNRSINDTEQNIYLYYSSNIS